MTQNLISASSLFQILIKESLLRRFMCWLKDLFLIHSQVKSFQIALDCGAKVCVFRLKSDEEWIKIMITPWIMKKFSCIQLYEDSHRSHYSPGPWTDRTRSITFRLPNRIDYFPGPGQDQDQELKNIGASDSEGTETCDNFENLGPTVPWIYDQNLIIGS